MEKYVNAEWAAKYPFDPHSKLYLKKVALDIDEYFSKDLIHVVEHAYKRALSIRNRLKHTWENNELEAISYFIAILIVRGTENRYIYYMYADAESKRAYRILLRDKDESLGILAEHLGLPIKYDNEKRSYRVPFIHYIKLTYRFLSPYWRPYYNLVLKGNILIDKKSAARILSEVSKEIVIDEIDRITFVPDRIMSYSEKLLSELSDIIERIDQSTKIASYISTKNINYYPPCIRWMINNIATGLPHIARFTLVTFLNKMGYSIEEITDLFSRTPDYNMERTKYQVEHICGLRGSRKIYSVPSCRTLKSYNLCFPDNICSFIKHPLQYISRVKKVEIK